MADNELFSADDSQSGSAAEDSQVGCFRCGLCCTLYRVFLTMEDAQQIAQYTGLALDDFIEDHVEPNWYELPDDILPDQYQIALRRVEARCIFLEQTADRKVSLCRIHAVRLLDCREWVGGLWRSACQRRLADYWNLKVYSGEQLDGSKKNIRNFNSLFKTLTDE